MSPDEYELYRYSLPPRYDGNRFRRKRVPREGEERSRGTSAEDPQEHVSSTVERERGRRSEALERLSEAEDEGAHVIPSSREGGTGLWDILKGFGKSLGYEEILIIAIILIVAHDGESSGDVVLLLSLLLLAG